MSPTLPILMSMLYRFVYNISFFIWALFLIDRGFSGSQIGIVLGVNSLVSLVASLPSGFANDRFSSRHLLRLGVVLFISQLLLVLFFTNFWVIVLAFVVSGIGHRLLDISIDSFVLKVEKKVERSGFLSWFLVLRFIGIALGILLGTTLLGLFSFDFVIYASIAGLLLMFVMSFFLTERVKASLSFGAIWADLKDARIVFFLASLTIFALHFGAEGVAYAPFLEQVLGLEGWELGAYMATGITLMGFAGFLFSRWMDRGVPGGYFLLAGLLVSGLFHMLMIVNDVTLSLMARVVHEIGDAAVFTFMYHGLSRLFPERSISSNLGIVTFLLVIAAGVSAFFYGFLLDATSVSTPLFVSGAVSLVVALVMGIGLFWLPKLRKKLF